MRRDLIASLVDFQRDFLEEGGFGEVQGGNLAAVQESVKPAAAVLKLARKAGFTVVHTREGHEPGLRDCPTCKVGRKSFPSTHAKQSHFLSLLGKPMLQIQGIPS